MSELPKPISMTRDKVVLSRAAWNELLDMIEDASDRATIRASEARQKAGIDDGMDAKHFRRILDGEHPIRAWRAQRSLTLSALAKLADVAPAYLSEVETGRKPGSAAALQRIARALRVDMDDVMPTRRIRAAKRRANR